MDKKQENESNLFDKNVSKHVGLILVIKQSHVFNTPHVFPICWVMMVLNVTGGAVCPQDFFPYRLLSSWKLWNSGPWNLPCVSFIHSLYKLHGCESAVAVLLQQRSLLLTCAHITDHKSAAVSPTCFPFPPAHTPSPPLSACVFLIFFLSVSLWRLHLDRPAWLYLPLPTHRSHR